jgi:phage tail sheath protein FI
VLLVDNDRIQVIADGPGDCVLSFSTGLAATLKANVATRTNVARYRLGVGPTLGAQANALAGSDGTVPSAGDIRGNELAKTGLYALQDVDLFNILCLPGQSDNLLLAEAMSYCERRRAFLIVDLPGSVDTLEKATNWITATSTPKSKNAAAYFPWITMPDPLQQYRPARFPPSGMLAGLYARTDGTRGVWKAPAGTEAVLRGPQGLTYLLTDGENGVLNPLGLNAIRSMRVYGIVAWGARTLDGADQKASEWKYIPVRRIALFIEESLYRGTQWVVFEPNDEPLWSQIRLNVGAFMHNLFRQGAFQGASPREAYLVKCDKETTTQADIDLGIVNILVGFAPLKPAEFVILKISQLAGQVEA